MTTTPGLYDFVVYQGATFNETLTWKDENGSPVDLTGFTARMKARPNYESASIFIDLTTGDGITLGGNAGTIQLLISAADTAALGIRTGVYDLELVSGAGVVTRLLQGKITISREVTR